MWSYADVQDRLEDAIAQTHGAFVLADDVRNVGAAHLVQQANINPGINEWLISVQTMLSRAEEDLISAVLLIRGKAIVLPATWCLTNVCYLLHQSLEKWLKAWLRFQKQGGTKSHSLEVLFKSAMHNLPELQSFYALLDQEFTAEIQSQFFPSDSLRYADTEEDKLVVWVEVLTTALCNSRQLIIEAIKTKLLANSQNGGEYEV
jgi:HEPN domain-containing protein